MKKRALKNIASVAVGFISTLILTIGMDTLLENTGVFPPVEEQLRVGFNILWMNIVAIIYRIAFSIIGGYLTAKLSANRPMRNVIILGFAGTIFAIAGNIVGSQIPEMANVLPLWFSIALVLIVYPSVWTGGKLAKIKQNEN